MKQILQPHDWGKSQESIALEKYVEVQVSSGHIELVVAKAGYVVCEECPYLGAPADSYVHDPGSVNQYDLVEIKCPYKYRDFFPRKCSYKL